MFLNLLSTPLLEHLNLLSPEQSLLWSFLLVTAIQTPLWVVGGYQDYKRHEVDNKICIILLALTSLHAILFIGLGATAIVCLLSYLTLRDKEFELVGQADFMMIAHWLTASFTFHTGELLMLLTSCVFLVFILLYTIVYRDDNGRKWKRGKMIPILPPYTATVVLMSLYQYPLSCYLFNLGW